MKLKRFLVPGVVAGLIAVGLTMPIGADDGVVSTTVTPLVLSVSVDEDTVNYGPLEFSAANDDRETALSQVINATNESSVIADLRIRGSDATPAEVSDSTWVLNCSPADVGTIAEDQYVHRFALGGSYDFFASSSKALCPVTSTLLMAGLSANGAGEIDFKLQWNMPLESDGGYSTRTSTVTIIAVQP